MVWALAPAAAAVAASPVALSIATLLLLGHRRRRNLRLFLGTWFTGLAATATVLLHVLPGSPVGAPEVATSRTAARVVGSALLLVAGVITWLGTRPRTRASLPVRLAGRLDRAPPITVVVVAAVLAVNPVNLALVGAGVHAVPRPAPAGGVAVLVAVTFAAATSVPLLMLAGAANVVPAASDPALRRFGAWLAEHGDVVTAVVLTSAALWVLLR